MSTCKPSEQYLGKLRERYRKARKKERGRILDEFVANAPKTPYQRVLDSSQVSLKDKRKLRAIHAQLDIVELKRQIDKLMDALIPSKQW